MSFFDDDAVPQEPVSRRPRRTERDRTRQRYLRLGILIVVGFLVVLLLALGVKACRARAKEAAYREYFSAVQTAIDDSDEIGKRIGVLLTNPTKFSAREIKDELDKIVAQQQEIADRAAKFDTPKKLRDEQAVFAEGMRIRASGAVLLRQGMQAAMTGKNVKATARKLAALQGYFAGPDVYYGELYKTQAQKAMSDDGVSNVAVPASDFYLKTSFFESSSIENALKGMQSSAKITGIHGVGLISTVVKPAGVTLSTTKDNRFESSPGLVFAVTVQNQGSVTEQNVPVTLTYQPPNGGPPQKVTATIQSIAAGQKKRSSSPASTSTASRSAGHRPSRSWPAP